MGHSPDSPSCQDDYDLTELTLRAMMRSVRFIRQIMEPFFERLEISPSQWVVMRVMLRHEAETGRPARLIDLSATLMIRQPTLTAVMNKLVASGLVERVSAQDDRRVRFVRLSTQGRDLMNRADEAHRVNISALFNVWSDHEKEQILDLFRKLENHLMKYMTSGSKLRNHSFNHEDKALRSKS